MFVAYIFLYIPVYKGNILVYHIFVHDNVFYLSLIYDNIFINILYIYKSDRIMVLLPLIFQDEI